LTFKIHSSFPPTPAWLLLLLLLLLLHMRLDVFTA
jgi:hypothetical protein